jgi:16S rRNA processing protein RimM
MAGHRELDWDAMALVGRIVRAHGIRGEVLVHPETDFVAERFRPGAVLYTRRAGSLERIAISGARMHQGRALLRIAGVGTMNEAQAMAGLELRVPLAELTPLPEGRYYRHELSGCRVETVEGDPVGVVDRVQGTGSSCLVVTATSGREILIPLADEICVVIDPGARRIVIRPPRGLLDLNEPEGRRRRP